MTPKKFKEKQSELGMNNKQIADALKKTAQTISNWRAGRQTIPDHVEVMLDLLIEKKATGA